MKKFKKYITKAKKLGATDAKIIPADTIVTAEWVRFKCQFGCGGYGRYLKCPPNTPTPEETGKMISGYKYALLVHVDEDADVNKMIYKLEKEIFLDGYYKAFGMGAGPCLFCKKCGEVCKHPGKARPSMEGCGIDVYATVRRHGCPIEVVRTKDCQGNYYGVVMIE